MATGPRIIVALDYSTEDEARRFVAQVSPTRCRLKVGLELYTASGPNFIRELVQAGFGVFLDLKLHDIPNTVEQACRQASRLGVELLTVHCLGGRAMLEAARRGAREASRVDADAKGPPAVEEEGRPDAREEGRPDERSTKKPLKVIGVTLLTSLAASDLDDIGLAGGVSERALALAKLAHAAGLDGVVCAPAEAEMLRRRFGPDFLLVTPGVRPSGSPTQDQQRVLTPGEAVARGADLLVIGRPITRAKDPRTSLDQIRNEIAEA